MSLVFGLTINDYLSVSWKLRLRLGGADDGCGHEDLEYLGSQRTEGGENRYFRCRKCGDVLVVLPDGSRAYVIKGRDSKVF